MNKYEQYNDESLIDKYRQTHDNYWLGIILQRYTLLLLGVCMKYLRNEEEAKDAVQQVFYKVLNDFPKNNIQSFKAWLYIVTKNHCLMQLRSAKNAVLEEWKDDLKELMQEEIPKSYLQNDQLFTYMQLALQELNKEQRQCISLFYLDKKSYFEISEITGFSDSQVKSYIQNGKRNLKISIEKMTRKNVEK
ncbi:MAG: sigma-70 family RNA polymerase sigma factor [Arachidicoccus sp.]|nr:sigma-70 family RNA polymerase sigma factor [Arachidicoccus sp.]